MQIQWYPGHMYKAGQEIKKILPGIDLLIEVLDSRIPFSSRNPWLAQLRGGKPVICVLNKSDLADPEMTGLWQKHLEREHMVKTLAVTSKQPDKIRRIGGLCHQFFPERSSSRKVIRAMVMGIPNVGKSTIINIIAGRAIAKTGNEPAVTKRQQHINLQNNIVLSDTPGVLWPNIENRNSGYRLAATGAVKDTVFAYEDIALFVLEYLLQRYPLSLQERYALETLPDDPSAALWAIGKKRGCLKTGNQIDTERTAKLFLTEFRACVLGRISLETPDMAKEEMAAVEAIRRQETIKKTKGISKPPVDGQPGSAQNEFVQEKAIEIGVLP